MKITTTFTCSKCAYQSSKWLGKCPQCEAWNSFSEEKITSPLRKKIQSHARTPLAYETIEKKLETEIRVPIGITELDRVLGGGIIPGSLMLLAGEPGIGKSTLTLQIAASLCGKGQRVLYVSGEESEEQIALRGKRLSLNLKTLRLLCETNAETIVATANEEKPDLLILDSIQVIYSGNIPGGAGSVSQVRLCTEALMEFAKPRRLPVLLIGHVTKDGTLAGPRVLEHLVDAVFMIEGDRNHDFRIVRGVKNRFGGTNEIGVFDMGEKGLIEVKNPSARMIGDQRRGVPGTALTCIMEGSRPFIVEVQALTAATNFGYAKRTSSGFDVNRLNLLIAVTERHLGVNLANYDIFVNVVGGMKISEPSADLAIIMAILSSLKNIPITETSVFCGEAGLSGEVRSIQHYKRREKECQGLGLTIVANTEKRRMTLREIKESSRL